MDDSVSEEISEILGDSSFVVVVLSVVLSVVSSVVSSISSSISSVAPLDVCLDADVYFGFILFF